MLVLNFGLSAFQCLTYKFFSLKFYRESLDLIFLFSKWSICLKTHEIHHKASSKKFYKKTKKQLEPVLLFFSKASPSLISVRIRLIFNIYQLNNYIIYSRILINQAHFSKNLYVSKVKP